MSLASKLWDVYRRESALHAGWRSFGFLYEHFVRPTFPPRAVKISKLNGVPVVFPDARMCDGVVGITNYEGPLVRGMKQSIAAGDEVAIVGGGYGVSAIIARRIVGEAGSVTVFEGSRDMIDNIRCSLKINDLSGVELNHNIVSKAMSLYGSAGTADTISPSEIPPSDTLVLDCEGAESAVISELQHLPDSIVVETHGVFESPPDQVKTALRDRGYSVRDEFVMSEEKGVSVLVADV